MKNIVFENVKKAYGKNVVVEDLCMEVKEGERLSVRLWKIDDTSHDCGTGKCDCRKPMDARPGGK